MAGCGYNPACKITGLAKDVVGSVAGGVIDQLAKAVEQAVGRAVASVGTLWVKVGTPNLTSSDGGSTPSATVGFLQGSLWWYMAAAAVASVLVAGGKMAWEGRAQPGRDLMKSLMTLVVVSGAGLTAISLATAAADGFSKWIIDNSLNGRGFGENIALLLGLTGISGLGAIIVIVLGLIAFVASIVQIALMVVRGGMLVILAGIFPLSAAATNTEWGKSWFRKCLAWTVAFVLYKPVAAIVYATAFQLASSHVFGGGDQLLSAITGLVLMILALVALPALLRFVTPMVGAMTGGGGGGGAMATGAIAAMPSGAMRIPRGAGGSNGAAAGGASASSAPTGANGATGGRGSVGSNGSSPERAGAGRGAATGASAGASAAGASAGGGATAGGGAAASGGAAAGAAGAAGAAAGPVGAAAAAAAQVAKGAKNAANGAVEPQGQDQNGGGPSGSR